MIEPITKINQGFVYNEIYNERFKHFNYCTFYKHANRLEFKFPTTISFDQNSPISTRQDRLTSATEIDLRRHEVNWSSENANKRGSEKRKEEKIWIFEIISGHSTCVMTLRNFRQLSCDDKRCETRTWKLFYQVANRQSRVRRSGSFTLYIKRVKYD